MRKASEVPEAPTMRYPRDRIDGGITDHKVTVSSLKPDFAEEVRWSLSCVLSQVVLESANTHMSRSSHLPWPYRLICVLVDVGDGRLYLRLCRVSAVTLRSPLGVVCHQGGGE